jgi:hypothetical protein
MCCFSSPPKAIASTSILSRVDGEHQLIAYEMQFSASKELAMILPIPIVPGCPEDSLNFISLENYKTLFSDLHDWFNPMPKGRARSAAPRSSAPRLVVHSVGAFEASFVPSIADFIRLDPRFRINAQILSTWPQYADYGFAVFKLKAGDDQQVHPMAFSFTTRDPSRSFFPTLHIHGEEATLHERFDHDLYLQLPDAPSVKPPPPFSNEEIITANRDSDADWAARGARWEQESPPPPAPPTSPTAPPVADPIKDVAEAVSSFSSPGAAGPIAPPKDGPRKVNVPRKVGPLESAEPDYSHEIRRAPKWRGGRTPPDYKFDCSRTGGVMAQSWPTYTVHIGGTFPNRDIWVPSRPPPTQTHR